MTSVIRKPQTGSRLASPIAFFTVSLAHQSVTQHHIQAAVHSAAGVAAGVAQAAHPVAEVADPPAAAEAAAGAAAGNLPIILTLI